MSVSLLHLLGLLFLAALAAGLLATPLARRLALRLGLVDQPGDRKIHAEPMPYGGGIAIYAAVTGLVATGLGAALGIDWNRLAPAIGVELAPVIGGLNLQGTHGRLAAILCGGTAMFLLGLVDDAARLGPRSKLAAQFLAALLPVWAGVRVNLFLGIPWLEGIVTVLWIVTVTNAFNLLDNMDGLSAGVAAIASTLFFVVAVQSSQIFVAAFLAVLAGVLLGFLRYNFAPARLFMGDAGSLFVGFLLGSLTVACTYYENRGSLYAVAMPILILGVPLFDTLSVLVIRWRRGAPLFVGDTNHFSHRLVRLGMTKREAVLNYYLLALILGGAATLLGQLDATGATVVFLIGLGILVLIALLEKAAGQREG